MTVLNKADCEKINEVVDYILEHYCVPVGEVKRRFGLTNEEYDMISDLMLPAVRHFNEERRLKQEITSLLDHYGEEKERKERDRRLGYFTSTNPNC